MRINRNLQRNMKLLSSIKAEVRKEQQENREITWFGKILEEALVELEEFGDLHEEQCGCLREWECDCEMNGMKGFLRDKMEKLNQFWIRNINEHRPHCSPAGNKMLTRIQGKKNRSRIQTLQNYQEFTK